MTGVAGQKAPMMAAELGVDIDRLATLLAEAVCQQLLERGEARADFPGERGRGAFLHISTWQSITVPHRGLIFYQRIQRATKPHCHAHAGARTVRYSHAS
jgi:hypothetical protein